MTQEGLLGQAHQRAQRRFAAMVTTHDYAVPGSRGARLYVQAERLVDSLIQEAVRERTFAEMDALLAADHDYHVLRGVDMADCDDCADVTEAESRLLWGDR